MAKGTYKKWSKEERNFSYELTKIAEKLGWIKKRNSCERCTQSEGIIHLHNEDYDVTIRVLTAAILDKETPAITEEQKKEINGVLEVLCWRCHMIHHSVHRNKAAHDKYFAEVAEGKMYPAVFQHNFYALAANGL